MNHVSFPGLGISDLEINRVAFSIGSFNIYWYGIVIACGLLLAVTYAYFNAERYGVDQNRLFDCVIVGIVTAIIGARLYYVFSEWDRYNGDFGEIISVRDGGLAIYGGIIGALVGGLITAKIRKVKFLPLLDLTMISFLIGQSIGRWGNFFNQEAYGAETDSLFRMVSENTGGVPVHPCFLYESVWCALGFVLLHIFNRKFQKYHGQILYLYMVWYGFERMIVEGLRQDSLYWTFFGVTFRASQVISVILFVSGIVLLIVNRKKDDGMRNYKPKKKSSGKKSKAKG